MSLSLNTLIYDMPSEEYHSTEGTYSSSQLKVILEDVETFKKTYIDKSVGKLSIPAFDVGTYFHTGVLEPHKLKKDCAVYPGNRRAGAAWEKFQKIHKGKALLTKNDAEKGEDLIKLVKASPIAMDYVKRGTPEVSIFITLAVELKPRVEESIIYAPDQELVLTKEGWVRFKGKIPKNCVKIVVKVRADSLGSGYVLDLKSTTVNAKDKREVQQCVSNYSYDLSAAFYLDIFTAGMEKDAGVFLWTFASKGYHNCKTWQATKNNILVGRAKWSLAVKLIAKGIKTDWEVTDELGMLDPNDYELKWLQDVPQVKVKAAPKTETENDGTDCL